jgi:hypothetical protein
LLGRVVRERLHVARRARGEREEIGEDERLRRGLRRRRAHRRVGRQRRPAGGAHLRRRRVVRGDGDEARRRVDRVREHRRREALLAVSATSATHCQPVHALDRPVHGSTLRARTQIVLPGATAGVSIVVASPSG